MVAVDLSKQEELDENPKANQQINFKARLTASTWLVIIIEEAKETILDFSAGTVKVL